ncbi:hypothetical protein EV360DRAFT_79624 [Lentinula raphanica]|nr:hypothetical protein EV360DRAFT_79624 [Lentinula raphanica]
MHITKSLVLPLSLLLWVFSTSVSVSAIPVGSDFQRRADSTLSDKVHEPDLHPQGEPMDVDTVDTVQVILAVDSSETISEALTRADEVQALQGFWDHAKSEEKSVIEGVLKLLKKEAVLRAISFERSGPLRVPARIQNAVSVFFSRRFGFQTLALFGPESVYKEKDLTKGLTLFCRQPVPLSAERKEGGEVVGKEDKTEYVWAKYKIRRKPKRNAVPSAEDQSPEDKGVKGLGPGASKSVEESGISSQEVSGEQIHDDGSSTRVEKPGEPEGKKPDSLNQLPPLSQKVSGNQQPEGGSSTRSEKPQGEKLERSNQPPPLPQKTSGKENVDSDSSDELEPGELREERKDDRGTGPPPLPQQISGGQQYDGSRSTRLEKPGDPDRRNPGRLDRPGPHPKWVGNSYRPRYGDGYDGGGYGRGVPRRNFNGRRGSGRIDRGRSQPRSNYPKWRPRRRPQ